MLHGKVGGASFGTIQAVGLTGVMRRVLLYLAVREVPCWTSSGAGETKFGTPTCIAVSTSYS